MRRLDLLTGLACSDYGCPFLNPDKSEIHRAWETVSYGDESPNRMALTIQLRKS